MTAAGWPSLGHESRPWQSRYNRDDLTRAQWQQSQGDYRAAVVPHIAAAQVSLAGNVQAEAADASAILTRFDAELGGALFPFAAVLLRTESASSSEIENLTSGARAIAEAELGERDSGNAALIVRNVRAMQAALTLSNFIDGDSIIAMQEALLGAHFPRLVGGYRQEQVWIGGGGVSPHGALFVPPHHERIHSGMADLMAFIARDDIPVLVHAAIAHAQFETIHPFPDGNGRTGRALVQAVLRNKGLTRNVTVPVSAGLLHDVDDYYAALEEYRKGNLEPIVGAFARAAAISVANGRELVAEIAALNDSWQSAMRGIRADATARRIVELAVEQPVLNVRAVTSRLGVSAPAAYRAMDALVDRGILHAANSKKRNRIWIADRMIAALDDFAARAGRRQLPQSNEVT